MAAKLQGFVQLCFTLLLGGLIILFWMVLLSPGNEMTHWVFNLLAPVQVVLTSIYQMAGIPVFWVCDYIAHFLPPALTVLFPVTTPQAIVQAILDAIASIPGVSGQSVIEGAMQKISSFDYSYLFPGKIDWQIPITIWLWGLVESQILAFLRWLTNRQGEARYSMALAPEHLVASPTVYPAAAGGATPFSNSPPATPSPSASSASDDTWNTPAPEAQTPFSASPTTMSSVASVQEFSTSPAQAQPEFAADKELESDLLDGQENYQDELTRLYNKAYFKKTIEHLFAAAKLQGQSLGVLMIDLDDFETLNETQGQSMGDHVLRQVGHALGQVRPVQGSWVPCRWGGKSFAVILVNQPMMDAQHLAEQFRVQTAAARFESLPLGQVTVSSGLYNVRFSAANASYQLTPALLLELAEQQLYRAKQSGKNQLAADGIL